MLPSGALRTIYFFAFFVSRGYLQSILPNHPLLHHSSPTSAQEVEHCLASVKPSVQPPVPQKKKIKGWGYDSALTSHKKDPGFNPSTTLKNK
jgi:hypothetical protein